MRSVEYFDNITNNWEGISWTDVVSGTTIRISEEDGTSVTDGTGVAELYAVTDSYLSAASGTEDVWTVDVYDPEPYPVAKRAE
jgi:hypothetical protein